MEIFAWRNLGRSALWGAGLFLVFHFVFFFGMYLASPRIYVVREDASSDTRVIALRTLWADRVFHPTRIPVPDLWRAKGFEPADPPVFVPTSFGGERPVAWNDFQGFPLRWTRSIAYSDESDVRGWYGPVSIGSGWPFQISDETPDGVLSTRFALWPSLLPAVLNWLIYTLLWVAATGVFRAFRRKHGVPAAMSVDK